MENLANNPGWGRPPHNPACLEIKITLAYIIRANHKPLKVDYSTNFARPLAYPPIFSPMRSVLKSEIQSLISISLSCLLITLVSRLLFGCHGFPNLFLSFVQYTQVHSLHHERDESEGTDRDQDFVPLVIIRRVVTAIDL